MFTRRCRRKINKVVFVIVTMLVVSLSCSENRDCYQLSKKFSTYEQALGEIKSTHFKIEESFNTSKSSWIKAASFYSCDGSMGFFVLETDREEYVYANMPYQLWLNFKSAESLGEFYNAKIKGKYNLQLTK